MTAVLRHNRKQADRGAIPEFVVAVALACTLAGCTGDDARSPTDDPDATTVAAGASGGSTAAPTSARPSPSSELVDLGGGIAIENGDFTSEPGAAEAATTSVSRGLLGDRPGDVLLRPDDGAAIPQDWKVEFHPETWIRVGDIARVEATAAGVPYVAWLVREEDRWLLSHTTDPTGASPDALESPS